MELININSERFKQNLQNLINSSNLPISNIYYIISLIQKELEYKYYTILNSELAQQSQKQEEEEVQNEQSNEGIQEN